MSSKDNYAIESSACESKLQSCQTIVNARGVGYAIDVMLDPLGKYRFNSQT